MAGYLPLKTSPFGKVGNDLTGEPILVSDQTLVVLIVSQDECWHQQIPRLIRDRNGSSLVTLAANSEHLLVNIEVLRSHSESLSDTAADKAT